MLNDPELGAEIATLKAQQRSLLLGIKLTLAFFLIALTVVCGRLALSLPEKMEMFKDMLPGSKLPAVTRFVTAAPSAWIYTTGLLAVLGLGSLAIFQSHNRAILIAAVVIVLLFALWQILGAAIEAPFWMLMEQVGEPKQ